MRRIQHESQITNPMVNSRVWIGAVRDRKSCSDAIETGIRSVFDRSAKGETWAVKLNLTFPTYLPGVVNSPLFIEGLCAWAADVGLKIIFIEGDGGNGLFTAADAFNGNGITRMALRYGMRTRSISEEPWVWRTTSVLNKAVRLPYSPFFVRHEYDRLVSAPLFKTHVLTVVSLGMKNLWGCIPDSYRMYYHHLLDHGIVALTKELRPEFSIFDGVMALSGNGPIAGTPIPMNCVMVAGSIGAGEVAGLKLMGIARGRVKHLTIAEGEGILPPSDDLVALAPLEPFAGLNFVLTRTLVNRAVLRLGKHPRLQRIAYHSALSPLLYFVVNMLRRGSASEKLWLESQNGHYTPIPRRRLAK